LELPSYVYQKLLEKVRLDSYNTRDTVLQIYIAWSLELTDVIHSNFQVVTVSIYRWLKKSIFNSDYCH
jgi:hypothetical protein